MRKRILLVFGTRPEAIKMAPVHRALKARPDDFETLCCVTAQHREMLDQVLRSFAIAPDFDLDLMRAGQHLAELHAGVLGSMTQVLRAASPDLVLVHGDTTTTLASAQAAFYAGIPIGHVEAGLRSGDLAAPFPEEMNRRVVDAIARYRFAPTAAARDNLLREGCDPASVVVTGNTVVDAVRLAAARGSEIDAVLDPALGAARRRGRYVLVTCHRRETIASGLPDVCAALAELAVAFPDVALVFPVHPNPELRAQVSACLGGHDNLHLVDPLPYEAFLPALRGSHFILTDSGGIQEEALALGKPVLVMRGVTERPEAIAAGGARLVGTDRATIVAAAAELLRDDRLHAAMAGAKNPFGDGRAAERIAAFLAGEPVR